MKTTVSIIITLFFILSTNCIALIKNIEPVGEKNS